MIFRLKPAKNAVIMTLAVFVTALEGLAAFSPRHSEPLMISSISSSSRNDPSVALGLTSGLIAWEENGYAGSDTYVVAQRLDANRNELFAPLMVDTDVVQASSGVRIASQPSGSSLFAWKKQQGGTAVLCYRLMTSSLQFNGGVQILGGGNGDVQSFDLVGLADGGFAVVWTAFDVSGGINCRYAVIGADGSVLLSANCGNGSGNDVVSSKVWAFDSGGFGIVSGAISQETGSLQTIVGSGGIVGGTQSLKLSIFSAGGAQVGTPIVLWQGNSSIPDFAVSKVAAPQAIIATASNTLGSGAITAVSIKSVSSTGLILEIDEVDLAGAAARPGSLEVQQLGGSAFLAYEVFSATRTSGGIRVLETGSGMELLSEGSDDAFPPSNVSLATVNGELTAVWTKYLRGLGNQIFHQSWKGGETLIRAPQPYVTALSSSSIEVSWPQGSIPEGAEVIVVETSNAFPEITTSSPSVSIGGLSPETGYQIQIRWKLGEGLESLNSEVVAVSTWSSDANGDGLPDTWQSLYWGSSSQSWPSGAIDSDGDGVPNFNEMIAGTNPTDAASFLNAKMTLVDGSIFLVWPSSSGRIYQAQYTVDFTNWTNIGPQILAAGSQESLQIGDLGKTGFFRIVLVK